MGIIKRKVFIIPMLKRFASAFTPKLEAGVSVGLYDFMRLACVEFASHEKKLPIHQFTAHPVPRLPAKQLKRRAPPPGAPVRDSLQRGGAKKLE